MKTFLQKNDCSQISSMNTIFTAVHSIMKLSEREAEYQLERNAELNFKEETWKNEHFLSYLFGMNH